MHLRGNPTNLPHSFLLALGLGLGFLFSEGTVPSCNLRLLLANVHCVPQVTAGGPPLSAHAFPCPSNVLSEIEQSCYPIPHVFTYNVAAVDLRCTRRRLRSTLPSLPPTELQWQQLPSSSALFGEAVTVHFGHN